MAQNRALPGHLDDGWQQRTVPVLAGLAAADIRIRDFQVHGSASGPAASTDPWSDLDVLITADAPVLAAEDFARQIGRLLAPVFAANRSGNSSRYCVRLVLRNLRRIDVTAAATPGDEPGQDPAACGQPPSDTVAELIGNFQFDAVLAAVKAARGDVLIGAHLTLQLARHVLVFAMLLRDRDAGTTHHRFGASRWDIWASRLAAAPASYSPAGITEAIRFYTMALEDIAALWAPAPQLDNSPLLALLDAIDACEAPDISVLHHSGNSSSQPPTGPAGMRPLASYNPQPETFSWRLARRVEFSWATPARLLFSISLTVFKC